VPPLSAEELYRRGVVHANAGRVRTARRALDTALSRTSDGDLRARITGTLAYLLSRLGEPEAAERLCLAALDSDATSAQTEAVLCGQLGAISLHRGATEDAVHWLTRGIDGDAEPVQRANMLVNRSVAYMQTQQLREARADLEAAAAAFALHGDPLDVAIAEHNAGYISLLEGDLIDALERMSAGRVIAATSPVNAAICDADRAEVLRDAGLATEAERLLAETARTFGAHGMRQQRAETELHLARSLLTHSPDRAAQFAASAARRFRALGSASWAARADAVRLRARLSGGQVGHIGSRARQHALPDPDAVQETARRLDRHGLRGDAAALRLSWLLARARRGVLGDPLPRLPASAPIPVRLLAYETRAARATAAGRHARARREAAAGVELLTNWQSAFGALDLQSSLAMHGTGLMIEGLDSAVRSGRPDLVFEWSERARELSQHVVALRPPPDPEAAADLAQLRMIRAENAGEEFFADPRAVALRDRARERQWSATSAGHVRERVELDELAAALDDRTALLAFVFSGDALACLVVTAGDATLVPLGEWSTIGALRSGLRADLDMSATVRTGPMATIVQRSLAARLEKLSEALLGPVLGSELGSVRGSLLDDVSRLVITAPGVLAGIPWGMLPAMRGRSFTLERSASAWVSSRNGASSGASSAASRDTAPGAVSGAVSGAPRGLRRGVAGRAGFVAGPRVARGTEEVRRASQFWRDPRVLTGAASTADAATTLAADVDVLHVAAHGRHAVDNPLFSGLELADGPLFGYDIDRMARVPETVVLSACEMGRSSVRWGEEAIGMTRAWLHAGSRCVVAAPVVVADDVACELLAAMHAALAEGEAPADALSRASTETGLVAPFQCHGSGF